MSSGFQQFKEMTEANLREAIRKREINDNLEQKSIKVTFKNGISDIDYQRIIKSIGSFYGIEKVIELDSFIEFSNELRLRFNEYLTTSWEKRRRENEQCHE